MKVKWLRLNIFTGQENTDRKQHGTLILSRLKSSIESNINNVSTIDISFEINYLYYCNLKKY